jgi:predicted dehydrogenase
VAEREVRLGLIGGGLMGRELASAAARWIHLADLGVRPRLVHVCDVNPEVLAFYERLADRPRLGSDWHEVLADPEVDAVYIAVPHNLHAELYVAALEAGKHLLGEKPFGIDLTANEAIMEAVERHPEQLVRCSSEMPFFPGGQAVWRWIADGRFGRPIEVRSLFLHSSDLDPDKPINWKRRAETNGAYGCLGDLGMHALHLPLRAGWAPLDVSAVLSDLFKERPDGRGGRAVADTPENAVLLCRAEHAGHEFPLRDQAGCAWPHEHLDDRGGWHGGLDCLHHQAPQDAANDALFSGRRAALGGNRPGVPVGLPEHHRPDLRVRLLRRPPADVGGLPGRAGARPRRDEPAVPLRDAGGGGVHTRSVHGGATKRRATERGAGQAPRCGSLRVT